MKSRFHNKKLRKQAGLHREILATLVLLLGAALLLGGFLFLRFNEQKLLDKHLQLLMLSSRSVVDNQHVDGSVAPDLKSLNRLRDELGVSAWWLFDSGMNQLASYSDHEAQRPGGMQLRTLLFQRREWLDLHWANFMTFGSAQPSDFVLIAEPLSGQGEVRGLLVVQYSLKDLRYEIWQARLWVFLYACGYGLVLAVVGFWLLRRNIIQPVKNLLEATQRVTEGEFDPLLTEEGPEEIAQLASSFNQMTSALNRSRCKTEETIDSLTRANLTLAETRDELIRSEKLATIGHLATGMAHEIGNPLGALIGYLGLLQKELPEGSQREMVILGAQEVDRIDRLVRDLLDYAAPGHSTPDPFNPWEAVLEATELLRQQGALKNIVLELEPICVLPVVAVDRRKLVQVLVNLLVNARDACGVGGGVRLSAEAQTQAVVLHVADTGGGMSPEVQQKLFEPFFTTKDPGQGRGLGLAICQRVIAEAGGEIRVRSIEGEGSLFSLFLPRVGLGDD